jgi:hypothetical protein
MRSRSDTVAAFLWWCLAGAGLCLGVLTLLTIGPFVLLATFALCGFLLWRLELGWGMAGLLSGAALPVWYVAWLNREGPGQVCRGDARAVTCTDQWSPWPFVALGLVLAVTGLVVFARRDRT